MTTSAKRRPRRREYLTHARLKGARPRQGATDEVLWDEHVRGLGLRMRYDAKGRLRKSFLLQRQLHGDGKPVRYKLGDFHGRDEAKAPDKPGMTLAEARGKAAELEREIRGGRRPREVRQEQQARTYGAVRDRFMREYVAKNCRPATERSYRLALSCPDVKAWEDRPIETVTTGDVRDVLKGIETRGAGTRANRVRSYLSKLFNWAAEEELVSVNPVRAAKKRAAEQPRDRCLTRSELAKVWSAAEADPSVSGGAVVRVLILTGQRVEQVQKMRWSELHGLDGEAPAWHVPPASMKGNQPHVVPLPWQAVEIIQSLPRMVGTDYVFTGQSGTEPYASTTQLKRRLDTATGVRDWMIRDIRRTVATYIASPPIKADEHIVARILSHNQARNASITARVYNTYDYMDERREVGRRARAHLGGRGRRERGHDANLHLHSHRPRAHGKSGLSGAWPSFDGAVVTQ